jgi:hypothetical protein
VVRRIVFILIALVAANRDKVSAADSLNSWQPLSPRATFENLKCGAFDGSGLLVAAGDNGAIAVSSDGTNWVAKGQPNAGNMPEIRGLTYDQGKFVGVGFGGWSVISTNNGDSWRFSWTGQIQTLNAVTFGPNGFIAVGNNGTILNSPDGIQWLPKLSGTTVRLNCVQGENGKYVAAGHGGIVLFSDDGSLWKPEESGVTNNIFALTASSNRFFIGCTDFRKGTICVRDNFKWSPVKGFTNSFIRSLTTFRGKLFGIGQSQSGQMLVAESSDGIDWTTRSIDLSGYGIPFSVGNALLHDDERLVVLGQGGTILTSSDGIVWALRTEYSVLGNGPIVFGNGRFCILEDQSPSSPPQFSVSFDGRTWHKKDIPISGLVSHFDSFSFCDGYFILSGSSWTKEYIFYSTDLEKWNYNAVTLAGATGVLNSYLNPPVFGNSISLAIGWHYEKSKPLVFIRPANQKDYIFRQINSTNISNATFGNGVFVGIGSKIATSQDGLFWVERDLPTTNYLYQMTFGNGKFVGFSSEPYNLGGTIITSSDGVNWTIKEGKDTLGRNINPNAVSFVNGQFVIGGWGVFSSLDGESWTRTYWTPQGVYNVAFGGGMYIARVGGGFAQSGSSVLRFLETETSVKTMRLKWTSDPGRIYRLLVRDLKGSLDWQALTDIPSAGTTTGFELSTDSEGRFFQVLALP